MTDNRTQTIAELNDLCRKATVAEDVVRRSDPVS